MFIKNLGQVYALIVCLVCTFVMMFSIGNGLHQAFKYIMPELSSSGYLARYENNRSFLRSLEATSDADKERLATLKALSEDDLNAQRLEERAGVIAKNQGDAISSFLGTLPFFLVAIAFFLFHWRLYRRFESPIRPKAYN